MTDASEMPGWPTPIVYTLEASQAEKFGSEPKVSVVQLLHERARSEAALARLRVAVPLLEKLYSHIGRLMNPLPSEEALHDEIHEALEIIGEVPPV